MLAFTVFGLPMPAGSKTVGRTKSGKTFVRDANPKAAPWKRQVAQVAGEAVDGADLLEGPLALSLTFVVPRPKGHFGARGLHRWAPTQPITKPDLTKLIRGVEDALTGVVWRDDAQVAAQRAVKRYGEPARCEIQVAPIAEVDQVDDQLGEQLALIGQEAR